MKRLCTILICLLLATTAYAGDPKAKRVRITDAGDYYTGTEVETALQEVGAGTTLDSRYLKLDCSNDPLTGTLDIGDTNFEIKLSGTNPTFVMDSTDTFEYDRGDNKWNWIIGSATEYTFDATGFDATANNITTTGTGDFGTLVTPYANTVTVATSGGDYTTIQAALDANTSGGELFLVYPGTYTDDTIHFTANNQVVRGMGASSKDCLVTTASSNIIDYAAYTGCKVYKIKADVTAATTLVRTVQGSSGSCNFKECHIGMTTNYATAGAQPCCYYSSGNGTVNITEGTIDYNHTGVAAIIKRAISWGANAPTYDLKRVNIDIDGSGASTATTIGYGTGNATIDVDECIAYVDDTDTTLPVGFYIGGGALEGEFAYNLLHVTGGQTNAYGVYVLGTGTIRGMFNHIHVQGATNNYSYGLGAACTLNSQFEDMIAPAGIQNTGGATVNLVNSPTDGALTASGTITAEQLTSTDDINATGTVTANDVVITSGQKLSNPTYVSSYVQLGQDVTVASNRYLNLASNGGVTRWVLNGLGDLVASGAYDITTTGFLGIGTASPGVGVDILDQQLRIARSTGSSGYGQLIFNDPTGDRFTFGLRDGDDDLYFRAGANTAFKVTQATGDFNFDDNTITTTGALNSGNATIGTLVGTEFPAVGVDPDVNAAGEIGRDSDDHSLRGYDGTNQYVYGQKVKTIDFTIAEPDTLGEADFLPLWTNTTPFSFVITDIYAESDVDDAACTLKFTTNGYTDHTNLTTIEALTISTDGTGVYTTLVEDGDIDSATIATGNEIGFDNGATDCNFIKIHIQGYFNADVA